MLAIGINYEPEPTGIAPYTTGIAEHWAASGASVTVVAGPPSYPAWKMAPEDQVWRRTTVVRGVRLLRLWHYVPGRQTAFRRMLYEVSFGGHTLLTRTGIRPDLVFTVVPSLMGAAAAAVVARRHGVPLVVHVQDLMGKAAAQSGISGGDRLASAAARVESFVFKQAAAVAVVSEAFRPVVEAYGVEPSRIHLVRNWTHIGGADTDRETMRAAMGWPRDRTVALHTGNMGWKQDLGNIIEAARCSVDDPILWVLMGDGSQRDALAAQASGLPNLQMLPPCDRSSYPAVLAAADVLIVNERPSLGEMSLPGKLTSYMTTRLPIVAAVAEGSATAQEVAGLAGTRRVGPGDPDALADACRDLSWSSVEDGRPLRRTVSKQQSLSILDSIVREVLDRGVPVVARRGVQSL